MNRAFVEKLTMPHDKHYDKDWNRTGSTEHQGDRDVHYDKDWNKTGNTEHHGDRDTHYDKDWNKVGHTVHHGDRDVHYDKDWNKVGHAVHQGDHDVEYDKDWNKVAYTERQDGHSGHSEKFHGSGHVKEHSNPTSPPPTSTNVGADYTSEPSFGHSALPSRTAAGQFSVGKWLLAVGIFLVVIILLVSNLARVARFQPQPPSQSTLTKTILLKGKGAGCRGRRGTKGPECLFVADLDTPLFEGGHTLDLMGPNEARVFFESRQNDPNHGTYPLKACLTNVSGKVYVFGPAGQRVKATRFERGSREWQEILANCPPF